MRIIADTNIILRLIKKDDDKQFDAAYKLLKESEEIIIPTYVFCEICWVLSQGYGLKSEALYEEIRLLSESDKVVFVEDEIEAGLAMLSNGGDFADGVNAYAGRKMSKCRAVFASFDRKAIRLLAKQGIPTLLPE